MARAGIVILGNLANVLTFGVIERNELLDAASGQLVIDLDTTKFVVRSVVQVVQITLLADPIQPISSLSMFDSLLILILDPCFGMIVRQIALTTLIAGAADRAAVFADSK